LATEAEQVHEKVSPGDPFIAGASRTSYRVGPFPWGTTKKAIQRLFQSWGWVAKAIHPVAKAKDSSGLMWLVHATSPPGHLVYQLQHGDVIIHQEPQHSREVWRPPQAQASLEEIKAQQQEETSDPWAESAKQLTRKSEVSTDQKIAKHLEARMNH